MTGIKTHPFFSLYGTSSPPSRSSTTSPFSPSLSSSPSPSLFDLSLATPEQPLDETCLQNLLTLFRSLSRSELVAALLRRTERNWEKAFYGLLKRYRERQAEEFGMGMSFVDEGHLATATNERIAENGGKAME